MPFNPDEFLKGNDLPEGDFTKKGEDIPRAAGLIDFIKYNVAHYNPNSPENLAAMAGSVGNISKLPVDVASRMARASEQGFHPDTYYHGSPKGDIQEFQPKDANMVFVTKDPTYANRFSGEEGSVYPLKINTKNTFDYENPEHFKAIKDELIKHNTEHFTGFKDASKRAERLVDRYSRQIKEGTIGDINKPEVLQAMQNAGFDSAFVQHDGVKNIGVFNPSNIRSTTATFDPAQATSPKIGYAQGGMVSFNPDEFIAQSAAPEASQGFDPDAFLSSPVSESEKANQAQAQENQLQDQYGTTGQQAIAGLEAVGKGLAGPLATGAEVALGVKPEDITGREEANPITHVAGEVAGLVSPVGQGALLTKAGSGAVKLAGKLAPSIVEKGVLAGIERGAVKIAAENALYQSGDELSKMIKQDPNQSIQTAITDVGMAAVLGGIVGGGIGAVSPLWKVTVGNKAGQIASDFKARMSEHLNNPEPAAALTDELSNYHTNIKSMANEVYGAQGLKAQEVSKLVPEDITPKISQQAQNISTQAEDALKEMHAKQVPERYQKKFINDMNTYTEVATRPDATPIELFNAAQDLKQTVQGYSKGNYGPFAVPSYHEAYDFLNITKNLGKDLRMGLEDPSVWGKAADRQQSINKAFSEYLPSLKDFEKKFTVELNGERVIDPGKVQTYVNQAGKASAEIKKSMLENFVNASEKYKQVIADTHSNLGVENPMAPSSLTYIQGSLRDLPAGAKLADSFIKNSAGKLGGAAIGAVAGKLSHIPFGEVAGAYLGEKFLGSIMPGIAKAVLEKLPSGEGLEAARIYGETLAKGVKLTDDAVKNLFRSGQDVLRENKQPTKLQREKLVASLDKLKIDPSSLTKIGGDINHYMPDHAVALGSTAQNVVSFLNSLKPDTDPKAPLDGPLKVSKAVQAQYDRALDIANQPLVVLSSLKDGTLNSHDVIALQRMYPDLYNSLKQKVMNQVIAVKSKDDNIPYKTRLGISTFMAQPMDSTMLPGSILAAQPLPNAPQSPQTQQQGGGNRPSQLKNKTSQMAFTGDQNAEAIAAGNRKA